MGTKDTYPALHLNSNHKSHPTTSRHTGKSKNIKEEGDPHKTWRQETNDMKSEKVNERVKLLKVQDPIMNPKKPRFTVRFQILSMIEQALFELLSRIKLLNHLSVFDILAKGPHHSPPHSCL